MNASGNPALVLNADFRPLSYYPLSLCSWQDAVKSVFLDRVSVIEKYDKSKKYSKNTIFYKLEEIDAIMFDLLKNRVDGIFINSYYKIGKSEKAREMFEEISKKYQENLEYYSSISNENKNRYAEEIYTDIERYRSLVDVLISYEEGDYLESKMQEFNDYLDLFL